MKEAVAEIKAKSGQPTSCVVYVRKRAQTAALIKENVSKLGQLDGAASLAGVVGKEIGVCLLKDVSDEDWELTMRINPTGIMNRMLQRPGDEGPGQFGLLLELSWCRRSGKVSRILRK